MQQITKFTAAFIIIAFLAACGNSKKDSVSIINEKKVELEKLTKEKNENER